MLFHVSLAYLQPGAPIDPGNWGRQLRQFTLPNLPDAPNTSTLAWEGILEVSRQNLMPTAPSRLNCVFACETVENARRFRDTHRKEGHILTVERDPEAKIHRGNFALLTAEGASGTPYVDFYIERARRYWTEVSDFDYAELLISSRVIVRGLIE